MGRERILKKIEKKAARHVTFSKRRKGLIKKAKEISVLCDADVGLIIFSATGGLFEYSTSSMKMILKKYSESFTGNFNIEFDSQDFKSIIEEMENNAYILRHMDGEDLEGLTIEELQSLERMLEVGLHKIQSKKEDAVIPTFPHQLHHPRMDGLEILPYLWIKGPNGLECKQEKQMEQENARLRLEVDRLKQHFNLENNTAVESLLIESLETRNHSQSPESIHNSYTPMSQHKTSIQHNEASDASLQLGLSI